MERRARVVTVLDDAVSVADAVRRGETSAGVVLERAVAAIDASDGGLHAFVALDLAAARAAAARIDDVVGRGGDPGPLAGVPLGVKDTHDAVGFPTTHGCRLFAGARPATADAVVVARLRRAGAVVVGKTNTAELQFSASGGNSLFGPTRHPTLPGRTPGGSSGGSAVAVAAGMVPLATGTDGGGSIRCPSAACELPGFKPSLGRVPTLDGRERPSAWPSLSCDGVVAGTLRSVARAYDAVTGPHRADPFSQWCGATRWEDVVVRAPDGVAPRLAWTADLGWSEPDPGVAARCADVVAQLAAAGAPVSDAGPLGEHDPARTWTVIAAAGTRHWLGGNDADLEQVDPNIRDLLRRFGEQSVQELLDANDAAACLRAALHGELDRCGADVLVCPTISHEVPDEAGAYRSGWVRNTYAFNLTGSPAATIPVGRTTTGSPVGLQLVGRPGADATVLAAAAWADAVLHR
jgi:aspartyl-tRNA(Asn)/glutamyl-tRNA(Gln) amidotransferase subunit A